MLVADLLAEGGFARAVPSVRAGGVVVSLALLRVVLQISNERARVRHNDQMDQMLAWMDEAGIDQCDLCVDWRERVAAFADDYLVSDSVLDSPCEVAFSEHRDWYLPIQHADCMTYAGRPLWSVWRDDAGGPLDAPDWIAAGGVCEEAGEIEQLVLRRGECDSAAREAAFGVCAPAIWRDLSGRVVVITALSQEARWLREGFCEVVIDAPVYMPAGSMLAFQLGKEVCASDRRFFRDGWIS